MPASSRKKSYPKSYPFSQIDVFGKQALSGNALAVVHDADDWTEAQMQTFANWTNLAETTFLMQPSSAGKAAGADYRVRIFTTVEEMPFAGHPTLGSCYAWLHAGGAARDGDVVQECAKGLVRVRLDAERPARLAFAAPSSNRAEISADKLGAICAAIGIAPAQVMAAQSLCNGPTFHALWLTTPEQVLALRPNFAALASLDVKLGVAAPYAPNLAKQAEADIEVRVFVPAELAPEDPVTGSFNASLAQWLIAERYMPANYIAAQGQCLGRAGRVYISCDDEDQVWVGGDSAVVLHGSCHLA